MFEGVPMGEAEVGGGGVDLFQVRGAASLNKNTAFKERITH